MLGLQEEKESIQFTQEHVQNLVIKSIQPFDVQWGLIRSSDSFLKINDPQGLPPKRDGNQNPGVNQQPVELKTALDKKFKVWCKMKNMSSSLSLKIESTQLQLILGSRDEQDDYRGSSDQDANIKALKLLPDSA